MGYYKFHFWLKNKSILLFRKIEKVMVLLIGTGVVFYLFKFKLSYIDSLSSHDLEAAFVAIGGVLGTIIALVFSLSIIPIQRAIENSSSFMADWYVKDKTTWTIFIILSVLTIGSFIFGVIEDKNGTAILFCSMILEVCLAFDLLRWYYRHICELLSLKPGIKNISNSLDSFIRRSEKMAKITGNLANQPPAIFYLNSSEHFHIINTLISEINDTALKAVSRKDIELVKVCVEEITEFSVNYLKIRKDNLVFFPDEEHFLLSESDINKSLGHIYECLSDLVKYAIEEKNDRTVRLVLRGLSRIAKTTIEIRHPGRSFEAPLTFGPIYRINAIVQNSLLVGNRDIALEGSKLLADLSIKSPDDLSQTAVHISSIKGILTILQTYLITQQPALADEVFKDLSGVVFHLIKSKHYEKNEILRQLYDDLLDVLPIFLKLEIPMSTSYAPYNVLNKVSIVVAITKNFNNALTNNNESDLNDAFRMNDLFYDHLMAISRKVNLESGMLLHYLSTTIEHLTDAYWGYASKISDVNLSSKFYDRINRYQAFFILRAKKLNPLKGKFEIIKGVDLLVRISLKSFVNRNKTVLVSCSENIKDIFDNFLGKLEAESLLADLIVKFKHLVFISEYMNDVETLIKLTTTLQSLENDFLTQYPDMANHLNREIREFENKIGAQGFSVSRDSSDMLNEIIRVVPRPS